VPGAASPGRLRWGWQRTAPRSAKRLQAIPLGRVGQPGEVAETILFLLSRANRHITGQVIGFNGGEFMA
jgi:NAD(P)-dependent dehydrogenase (short-subunit alcohol dehydrogenase family)